MKQNLILIYCVLSSIAIIYLLLDKSNKCDPNIISTSDLTITDSSDQRRLVISSKLPLPYFNGKEYNRKNNPAGLVFYDKYGNECGGIALSNNNDNELTALVFDYNQSESIYMFKSEGDNNIDYHSGFGINDKPATHDDPLKINVVQRVLLENKNGNASLILNDNDGNSRIILKVDTLDNASIVIKDKEGKIINEIK